MLGKIPDRCGDHIGASVKKRSEVVGFVSPMGQIALARPVPNPLLIHLQKKCVVGADVNDEMCRYRGEIKNPAKMYDGWRLARQIRRCDPFGIQGMHARVGLSRCEKTCREDSENEECLG